MKTKNQSKSLKNNIDHQSGWLEKELSGCEFSDKRLKKRFDLVCKQLWNGIGEPIPLACKDWANTKAAYRFFSNGAVNETQVLSGHFESTKERFSKEKNYILVLQDTTEFSYQGISANKIGSTRVIPNGKDIFGKPKKHTKRGILMHSSLAVTTDGLPLGLAAAKFWTRKKFKGANALKKKINPTRMPIEKKESYRWLENLKQSTKLFNKPDQCIHVGDRESDIYELFCTAKEMETHFLVRTCVDRLARDGKHTIEDEMNEVQVKGLHRIETRDKNGNPSEALLEIKYRRIKVLPPIGKKNKYPDLYLTVIHAEERKKPKNREKICWKLITDLSVKSKKEAIEKIKWYAMRWKIEIFHKILKSGCKAETSKLRTAERLTKLISVFCILSWRIFWMTMMNRFCKNAPARIAFTDTEINILDNIIKINKVKNKFLSTYLLKLAKLGGYLARTSDSPPGNTVIWRGLSRLTDIQLGFDLAMKIVGN